MPSPTMRVRMTFSIRTTASASNILRAIWAVIGLSFFNLLIVLAPFVTIVVLVISGWIVSISAVGSPLLVLINPIFYPGTFEWFDLFFSFMFSGVGILVGIGMYYVTKAIMSGFVRYLKFNVRFVKGGLNHG